MPEKKLRYPTYQDLLVSLIGAAFFMVPWYYIALTDASFSQILQSYVCAVWGGLASLMGISVLGGLKNLGIVLLGALSGSLIVGGLMSLLGLATY